MGDFGRRMEDMGERLGKAAEEIGQKVGAAATDAGKRVEESAKAATARVEVSVQAANENAASGPRMWFGLILIGLGFLLLAHQLNLFKWTTAYVWPAVLIIAGFALVVNNFRLPPLKPGPKP